MFQGNTDVIEAVGAPGAEREVCTVLEALNRISGKWAIGILLNLSHGPVRFTELERAVPGISRRMLTLTLRNLERDGLLVRTVYATVPPKVEYRATAMADELYTSLTGLTAWAERHRDAIASSRAAYDREQDAAGAPVDL
ncbi:MULTISPECIES: helix-turn-helix domain-containing protein [unclassified Streptomyces]|uniref:winged helix-turn-helix transcriptional regulator n=1 Tax=Streptomycetaceae TaxID=2062 RepID=UPI002E780804|nr:MULTISPECIES: helix-turn-helix domain-containing protein [unclassified Streptomyces]MED7955244.1 helix-turn-helix domain-containing protein [Streptomyces sp. BE303]MEE1825426.1 helix-turn-helix domain-containing protein [Streptomyces sp. BE20]